MHSAKQTSRHMLTVITADETECNEADWAPDSASSPPRVLSSLKFSNILENEFENGFEI